ncbi:hypothetical protein M1615_04835 [Patescibacteria group bacterium]|nr:hypothetical protein [Patescibacteria group bacterium]
MKELLKEKKVIIAGAVILVLVIAVGAFILFKGQKAPQSQADQGVQALPTQAPIPTITADSIGLSLKVGTPGKTVIASIANPQGISNIEYEFSYTSKGGIPRGTFGQIPLTSPYQAVITLGTCSDVCHYDTDISNIKIVLKITKTDGSIFQSETTLASAQ